MTPAKFNIQVYIQNSVMSVD